MSSCRHHALMLESGSQDVHIKRFVRHTKLDGIIMIQQH